MSVDDLTWAEWLALAAAVVFLLLPALAWRAVIDALTRMRLWRHYDDR
jgi:hypothetical protein